MDVKLPAHTMERVRGLCRLVDTANEWFLFKRNFVLFFLFASLRLRNFAFCLRTEPYRPRLRRVIVVFIP